MTRQADRRRPSSIESRVMTWRLGCDRTEHPEIEVVGDGREESEFVYEVEKAVS